MIEITIGDDIRFSVTLTKDNVPVPIDSGATIRAVLKHDNASISPLVTLSNAATGADWSNGVVIVEFTSAESATIKEVSHPLLEIEVDDSGLSTWHCGNVEIVPGIIS
jgi:hypothetical protein